MNKEVLLDFIWQSIGHPAFNNEHSFDTEKIEWFGEDPESNDIINS
jgi:hypothetical protein